MKALVAVCAVLLTTVLIEAVQAQVIVIDQSEHIIRPFPPRLPRPPRPRPEPIRPRYQIESFEVHGNVRDQAATMQISQTFKNPSQQTLETQLIFPMPKDAAISGLTLLVDGKELTGKLLKKDKAREIYEEIVRRQRDPALLEYIGQGLFQTSVFPVPPGASRTVQIRYSQFLSRDNGLVNVLLPIGTAKHSHSPVERFNATIRIETSKPLKTVYSPTHQIAIDRPDDRHATCRLSLHNVQNPDDFRLLYGVQEGLVGMNLMSYRPDKNEDGYFLLLASPDLQARKERELPKTVVFVLDRSGSMSGQKIEQARDALKFLIEQLKPADTFNIVAYDSAVESFRPELQRADESTRQAARGFADGLFAGGSTNIDAALQTALGMLVDSSRPSYVLFLTDGLPTVGERNEFRIAERVKEQNRVAARLFSFGVGFDVNSRLLDRLSRENRGQTVFVRPNEDIEASVAKLANRISSPLLTDVTAKIEFDKTPSPAAPSAIARVYPRELPDLFRGEQLVVVGRYRQHGTAKVTLTGMRSGKPESFNFPATFVDTSRDESGAFIEKLWATRRIGEIIDELDLHGQNQELVDELVQLSMRHGIITPYTSFLAEEDVRLADRDNLRRAGESARKALSEESGVSGFLQREFKNRLQFAEQAPAPADMSAPLASESLFGATRSMARGAASTNGIGGATRLPADAAEPAEKARKETIRRIGTKTFYWKNQVWQDSTVTEEEAKQATRVAQFSKEYFDLAAADNGSFGKYLVFNEPVVISLDGQVYRIEPEDASNKE